MTIRQSADVTFDPSLARPDKMGTEVREDGVNFALFSNAAEKVELCLFDESGQIETARVALPDMEGGVWHGFVLPRPWPLRS